MAGERLHLRALLLTVLLSWQRVSPSRVTELIFPFCRLLGLSDREEIELPLSTFPPTLFCALKLPDVAGFEVFQEMEVEIMNHTSGSRFC